MGEDCALKADDITLAALGHATTGWRHQAYSQGNANWAAEAAATAATGKDVS
jgi:hypothetical protein